MYDSPFAKAAVEEMLRDPGCDRVVSCPDCGALLMIRSSVPLPTDVQVIFVEHKC